MLSGGGTAATARPISSLPSIRIEFGARSKSPSGAPPWIVLTACANSSMSMTPRPPASVSCKTICRSMPPARSNKPLPRRGPPHRVSTTPRNTPVGSIWSRSRSARSKGSVSAGGSSIQSALEARSQHGSGSETKFAPVSTGCLQRTKLAPNWAALIQAYPKNQNYCDELLAVDEPAQDGFRAHGSSPSSGEALNSATAPPPQAGR